MRGAWWVLSTLVAAPAMAQPPSPPKTPRDSVAQLEQVQVRTTARPNSVRAAAPIEGMLLTTGARSEVVSLRKIDGSAAEKTGRQLFAKVPGVFVYDMDGTGNQINISTRGLDAHRSWEMNVRQDGVLVNSDIYGYPASHYSPPVESMEEVRLIRGTAGLQYGAQFGGVIDYVTRAADTTRALSYTGSHSAGSFGMRSTYHALGGRVGAVDWLAYATARETDGYRAASRSTYQAQFARLAWRATKVLQLRAQVGRSVYRAQVPGPLTDAQFANNPQQATRTRNYYSPDITVPSLTADWRASPRTDVRVQLSGLFGMRNSVMLPGFATSPDTLLATGAYAVRQVDIDHFSSRTGELRVIHRFEAGGRVHPLAAGVAIADNDMRRRQQGKGTGGEAWTLALSSGDFARDVRYRTRNVALFAEQLLQLTPQWSVVPGARLEQGTTTLRGRLAYYDPTSLPTDLEHHFPLLGVRTEYRSRGALAWYGGWSQSYRPQVLKDVIPESAIERVNPALKDAKGWTLEGGVRGGYEESGITFDVGAFRMRYDNRFGSVTLADAAGSYVYKSNLGSTVTNGLEARVDVPLLTRGATRLSVFTSTALFDAIYREGSVIDGGINRSLVGNQVESVPRVMTRNGLQALHAKWSGTLQVSYTSTTFADALNTVLPTANGARGKVPAYTLVDVNGGWQWRPGIRFAAGVNNLLDVSYFTKRPTMYPGPGVWPSDGRSMRITVEFR
jgi:Fe(3+) dicitrate transport protein